MGIQPTPAADKADTEITDFLGYVPNDLFPTDTQGQKIRRYRLLHGVTRKQLARQLNIDESTLDRIEADKEKTINRTSKRMREFPKSIDGRINEL